MTKNDEPVIPGFYQVGYTMISLDDIVGIEFNPPRFIIHTSGRIFLNVTNETEEALIEIAEGLFQALQDWQIKKYNA